MKILVINLEGISPELLFSDERLTSFRQLLHFGCYGQVALFPLSDAVPALMYMATSQTPDSYRPDSTATIWEYLAAQGKKAVVMGLPQSEALGISSFPPVTKEEDISIGYPLQPNVPASNEQVALLDAIYVMSRQQFEAARRIIEMTDWEYLHLISAGLEHLQQHFWHHFDSSHVSYGPENEHTDVVPDFYEYLDGELGSIFELLDEETAVLVVSTTPVHSASSGDSVPGGFFILAAANSPLQGEVKGAGLLDMAPTLLELSGAPIPDYMQGDSLFQLAALPDADPGDLSSEEEDLLRERLSGLGYIS